MSNRGPNKKRIVVHINSELDKYKEQLPPFFQKKLDKANETLKIAGIPDALLKQQNH